VDSRDLDAIEAVMAKARLQQVDSTTIARLDERPWVIPNHQARAALSTIPALIAEVRRLRQEQEAMATLG